MINHLKKNDTFLSIYLNSLQLIVIISIFIPVFVILLLGVVKKHIPWSELGEIFSISFWLHATQSTFLNNRDYVMITKDRIDNLPRFVYRYTDNIYICHRKDEAVIMTLKHGAKHRK